MIGELIVQGHGPRRKCLKFSGNKIITIYLEHDLDKYPTYLFSLMKMELFIKVDKVIVAITNPSDTKWSHYLENASMRDNREMEHDFSLDQVNNIRIKLLQMCLPVK